jgi:hypothetical protein
MSSNGGGEGYNTACVMRAQANNLQLHQHSWCSSQQRAWWLWWGRHNNLELPKWLELLVVLLCCCYSKLS